MLIIILNEDDDDDDDEFLCYLLRLLRARMFLNNLLPSLRPFEVIEAPNKSKIKTIKLNIHASQ
jgi:hypothetical protein